MKRFLKKANRGLILGAFALVALVIYIVVDYTSFNNEKPKIKEAVENYIGGFYDVLEQNDFKALEAYVNEKWTSEPVMPTWYFEDKESMSTLFDTLEEEETYSEYGEITFDMNKLSIKKSGPDMACVEVNFTAEIEYGSRSDIIEPFFPYLSCWYYEENEELKDKRYIYEMDFEGSIYLRRIDGEWKISQSDVWSMDCTQHEKEGE